MGTDRELQWLFYYRVLTLGAVAFLLPPLVAIAPAQLPYLGLATVGFLVLWNAPIWRQAHARPLVPALALALEGLAICGLAYAFGGATSPVMLLALPALAQGAFALPAGTYAVVASVILAGYAAVLGLEVDPGQLPFWVPLWSAALVLTAIWLGIAGALMRRGSLRAAVASRQHQRFRELVAQLPEAGEGAFWPALLAQVARQGGFTSAALIRWDGPRPLVVATDRQGAWEGLARRHEAHLRAARPCTFEEDARAAGGRPRAIAACPVPRRGGAPAMLAVMGPAPLPAEKIEARLQPFLPVAAAGVALDQPRVELHRQPVDWSVIMNATLHRLHGRLVRYLVLVHVDPGRIEADALLLADAIAHVIEEVLDRTPPQTPVRLTVRRRAAGWHFQVETEHPPAAREALPGPGLLLARQVVSAHGGAWEQVEEGTAAYRVGFTIPNGGGHGQVKPE